MFTASMSCKPLVTTKRQATQGAYFWGMREHALRSDLNRNANRAQEYHQLRKSTASDGGPTARPMSCWDSFAQATGLLASSGSCYRRAVRFKGEPSKEYSANRFTGIPIAATGGGQLQKPSTPEQATCALNRRDPNSSAKSLVGLMAQVRARCRSMRICQRSKKRRSARDNAYLQRIQAFAQIERFPQSDLERHGNGRTTPHSRGGRAMHCIGLKSGCGSQHGKIL